MIAQYETSKKKIGTLSVHVAIGKKHADLHLLKRFTGLAKKTIEQTTEQLTLALQTIEVHLIQVQ